MILFSWFANLDLDCQVASFREEMLARDSLQQAKD